MRRFQEPVFSRGAVADVVATAQRAKEQGHRFVSITATTCEEGVELLYVYRPTQPSAQLEGTTFVVAPGQHVASITDSYAEAFVFENETHDLFGVDFDGIAIDYGGDFYKVAVAYPMNPAAAVGETAEKGGDGDE